MNIVNNIVALAEDLPWWSVLIFVDEPKCPKSISERI